MLITLGHLHPKAAILTPVVTLMGFSSCWIMWKGCEILKYLFFTPIISQWLFIFFFFLLKRVHHLSLLPLASPSIGQQPMLGWILLETSNQVWVSGVLVGFLKTHFHPINPSQKFQQPPTRSRLPPNSLPEGKALYFEPGLLWYIQLHFFFFEWTVLPSIWKRKLMLLETDIG